MKKIILVMSLLAMVPVILPAQPGVLAMENDQPGEATALKKSVPNPIARLKAEKNFLKSHKEAENIRWFDDADGFFVYYNRDGKRGRSFYNRNGKFLYDVISYPEQFLSYQLKELVKSVYYMDYRIMHVSEVHVSGRVTHLIQITDDKTWKRVKIHNGELQLVEDYSAK